MAYANSQTGKQETIFSALDKWMLCSLVSYNYWPSYERHWQELEFVLEVVLKYNLSYVKLKKQKWLILGKAGSIGSVITTFKYKSLTCQKKSEYSSYSNYIFK